MHEFGTPQELSAAEAMIDVRLSAFVVDAYLKDFEGEEK
jgi:hypothetical protein